jgi:glycosyltransferase involved in cell wall biosynthesis
VRTIGRMPAPWPSVTAVMATRDRPHLVRLALDSIFSQSYPGEVDVVLVFDQGPVDPSIVYERPDQPITCISNDRTPGLPGARNTGVLKAGGDLIALCDDDDTWLPGKLLAQVELLQANPDAAVASSAILVDYAGSLTLRTSGLSRVGYRDLLRSRVSDVHPSTLLIRRDAFLDRIGFVDEEIPGAYGEDYEWLLRAAKIGDIVVAPQALTRVLWHERSYFASRWATIIEALEWLLDRYPDFADEPVGHARIAGQIAFAHAAKGDRLDAVRWASTALSGNRRELRAVLALAVASGSVSADRVLRALHRRGKGI